MAADCHSAASVLRHSGDAGSSAAACVVGILGKEGRQASPSSSPAASRLRLASGVRSGSGSQPQPASRRSASLAMSGFLRWSMSCDRCFALGLAHRFEDARLGHPAEIVVDRRRPTRRRHVETDRASELVRHGRCAAVIAVPGLLHGVDDERGAMGEQRHAASPSNASSASHRAPRRPRAAAWPSSRAAHRSPWPRRSR